jgi:hypothetical protein
MAKKSKPEEEEPKPTEAVLKFDEAISLLQVGCYGFNFRNMRGDTLRAMKDKDDHRCMITTVAVK